MTNLLQNFIGKKCNFRTVDGMYSLNHLTVVAISDNAVHCVKDNGLAIIINIDYISFVEEDRVKENKKEK